MTDSPKVIIHSDEDGEHEMSEFCWCEPRIEIKSDDRWVTVQ